MLKNNYLNIPEPVVGSFDCKIEEKGDIIYLDYLNEKNETILGITFFTREYQNFSFNEFSEFIQRKTIDVKKEYREIVKNAAVYHATYTKDFYNINYFDKFGNFLKQKSIPTNGIFGSDFYYKYYREFDSQKFNDSTLDITAGTIFIPKTIGFYKNQKTGYKELLFLSNDEKIIRTESIYEIDESNVMRIIESVNYLDKHATLAGINTGIIQVRYPKGIILSFLSYLKMI
jgi:hypothetical protein